MTYLDLLELFTAKTQQNNMTKIEFNSLLLSFLLLSLRGARAAAAAAVTLCCHLQEQRHIRITPQTSAVGEFSHFYLSYQPQQRHSLIWDEYKVKMCLFCQRKEIYKYILYYFIQTLIPIMLWAETGSVGNLSR